jgi:hypothetical protein
MIGVNSLRITKKCDNNVLFIQKISFEMDHFLIQTFFRNLEFKDGNDFMAIQ